jgi:hypothetical protein
MYGGRFFLAPNSVVPLKWGKTPKDADGFPHELLKNLSISSRY